MPQLSPFQMTEAQHWAGLTTTNHLGAIYQAAPQKASNLMRRIYTSNFGMDLDSYLSQIPYKVMETDDDFTWELIGSGKKNVKLIQAEITAGTPVAAGDQPGLALARFDMIFAEQWFTDVHTIVGEKNEVYQLRIVSDPVPDGLNWRYTVELVSGDLTAFVPVEELAPGKRWSREWSLVEPTLSKKGGGINFESPFTMRNAFSMIRMQHTTAGNMLNRPFATKWQSRGEDGELVTHTTWTQHEDYVFDWQFRQEKNKLMYYARSNKSANGEYFNVGNSGHILKQGAGIREQMEASNTSFYSTFNIDYLTEVLVDLSEGKLPTDDRHFVLRTGERGAIQFHKALEDQSQLFTPLRNEDRMFRASNSIADLGLGYGGQFVEYRGPNNVKVTLMVDSMYDDRERNKLYHPDGGVAESYRYDIMDIGTTNGEPNIQKFYVSGSEDIMGYIPGLRNPFSSSGERSQNLMAMPTDGYQVHRATVCGVAVYDPSRTASLIPSILA